MDPVLRAFRDLVAASDVDLARAALAIAAIEHPDLQPADHLTRLDELAVRSGAASVRGARARLDRLRAFLFAEEGFRGNADDYYDPRNSCLNDVLDRRLAEWTRERAAWEATERLQQAGVAAFPVYGLEDEKRDPHFRARGLLAWPSHPRIGTMEVYAHPIKLSATPGAVRGTAPALGEHTDEALGELLGLSPEELAQLRSGGVLA